MSIEIKSGTLADFFASAKETARQIDRGETLTPKHTVWMDAQDLMQLLKPERAALVKYLRKEKRVAFADLLKAMNRTPVSLNNDLQLLSKYDLVRVSKETNPGHGMRKMVEPSFGNETLEFRVSI